MPIATYTADMNHPELELRAEVDALKIELKALLRTLSGLVEHFDERLVWERARVIQEYNPELQKIADSAKAA